MVSVRGNGATEPFDARMPTDYPSHSLTSSSWLVS
jgi:hypothetical protein